MPFRPSLSCRYAMSLRVADEDLSPQQARILLMLMLLTATDIATVQQAYQTY